MTPNHQRPLPHARNKRAAFAAGRNGWPSPKEIAEQNSGYEATASEQEQWERGRQAVQV